MYSVVEGNTTTEKFKAGNTRKGDIFYETVQRAFDRPDINHGYNR